MFEHNIKLLFLPWFNSTINNTFFSFGITKLGSTFSLTPIPSPSSQAPRRLLNENNLGSISSNVKPLSGQENFVEKISFLFFLIF